MKRTLKIMVAVIALLGLLGGGFWYYQGQVAAAAGSTGSSDGTFTQTVAVTKGDLSSTISVVGELQAEQSATLAFEKMSGTAVLKTLDVAAGNTVTKGQVLATIDSAAYQQALDQAQSALQAAEDTLADLQTPATDLEISQANVAVAKAQETLAQAQQDLADLKSPDLTDLQTAVKDAQNNLDTLQIQVQLAGHDSLAQSERDLAYSVQWCERRIAELQALVAKGNANAEQTAELSTDQEKLTAAQADLARIQAERKLDTQALTTELAQAKVTLSESQQALADAQAGGDALTLAQKQLAVNAAEVSLQSAQEARADLDAGADATKLAAAQAAVDKKKLAVQEAQAALDGTQLTAPFDGTVLKTNVSAGDQISANTTILTVADLKGLQVVASIDETTIRQVAAGQKVSITFDAYPGQTFTGEVLSVPLQGNLQGGVTVYSVPVSLEGADDLSLLVGMTANVKIAVGSVTGGLLVPTMALTQNNGLYQVVVAGAEDATETVDVEVGLSNGTYTQITKGLNEGDLVVVQLSSSSSSSSSSQMGGNSIMGMTRALTGGR